MLHTTSFAPAVNPILRVDSYKTSHFTQYPPGATRVRSYISARGGAYPETVFFGLQAFVKEYLTVRITAEDVVAASEFCKSHGVPFNDAGWTRIVQVYGGYLPIEIEAVPEGTVMAPGNVQLQVVNTDWTMPWLTSYIETILLRAIWYPSTVATVSRRMKQFIYQGLVETADDPDAEIMFKLHDFGARGATSSEAAALGGMGHLVNFMGTDTLEAVMAAQRFYSEPMAGYSIPATEHSTMTAWGRKGETAAYLNFLRANPTGIIACVSDSYDIFNAVRNIWGGELKAEVLARKGTLVIRPDSGNPTTMPLDVIELAMDRFGYTTNSKGFKVLPDQVRVIQGDGMDETSIPQLITNAYERGISITNLAFGMGGGLLQKVNRDTLKYAMKASEVEIVGEWMPINKDPITDPGKASLRGRQAVISYNGELVTIPYANIPKGAHGATKNYLRPIYRDGVLLVDDTFQMIRERAAL